MNTPDHIEQWASRLREAERTATPIAPLRDEIPDGDTAYRVQLANVQHAVAQGRRVVGRRMGGRVGRPDRHRGGGVGRCAGRRAS